MRFRELLSCASALFAVAISMPIGAAAQSVGVETSVESDGSSTMVHTALIEASPKQVWHAISTAEGWMTWAVPIAWISNADGDVLETSYDPADSPGSPSTIQHRILVRIPERMLAFRTIKAPEGFPHWTTYQQVTSVFELEQVGDGTLVRLTSAGYPDTEAGRELVAFFERGNAETLEGLQKSFAAAP